MGSLTLERIAIAPTISCTAFLSCKTSHRSPPFTFPTRSLATSYEGRMHFFCIIITLSIVRERYVSPCVRFCCHFSQLMSSSITIPMCCRVAADIRARSLLVHFCHHIHCDHAGRRRCRFAPLKTCTSELYEHRGYANMESPRAHKRFMHCRR